MQEWDVLEVDRNCDLGQQGERAVVRSVDGPYVTLWFINRAPEDREVVTGAAYRYLRTVAP